MVYSLNKEMYGLETRSFGKKKTNNFYKDMPDVDHPGNFLIFLFEKIIVVH